MALTILEALKLNPGDVKRDTIIEIFARETDILGALPFKDINGNAYTYTQESVLPGIAFRGVNEGYSESTGVLNPQTETLTIAGGDLDVDKFIVKTQGMDQRAVHEAMKVKILAHTVSHKVIKGDSSAASKEFDGLQRRLLGNQLIANGAVSGGDALSLGNLDALIDAVDNPTHLIMSKAMRRLLNRASRDTTVGGFISWTVDQFGTRVMEYNGLPILIADKNADAFATLGFNEANPGGGSNVGTSIYCVSFMEGMCCGIQNGGIQVVDLGELQTKPVFRTRTEWYPGLVLEHPRAAARLYGIKNAAVVA